VAHEHEKLYCTAAPFPSISFTNFFNPETLEKVLSEFPDLSLEDAIIFNKKNEKKLAGKGEKAFGRETRKFMRFLNSEPFLEFIQTLTGIDEPLLPDPYFLGGGLHEIKKEGLLKVHADFNKHYDTGLDRRVNALIYLNKNWKDEYGGHIELWDRNMRQCEQRILPEFNTLVLFTTTSISYHGHPDPLTCPDGMSRKSLAVYYYSNGRPAGEVLPMREKHNTLFMARHGHEADHESILEKINVQNIYFVIKEITPPILLKAAKFLKRKITS